MGKRSRDKGARRERELVQAHQAIGIAAHRVPLSGAVEGYPGDVLLDVSGVGRMVGESKARASGNGFVTLEKWLGANDVLFLIRDRAEPLAVLPWRTWTKLLAALTAGQTTKPGNDNELSAVVAEQPR